MKASKELLQKVKELFISYWYTVDDIDDFRVMKYGTFSRVEFSADSYGNTKMPKINQSGGIFSEKEEIEKLKSNLEESYKLFDKLNDLLQKTY